MNRLSELREHDLALANTDAALMQLITRHPALLIARVRNGEWVWANRRWQDFFAGAKNSDQVIQLIAHLFPNPKALQLFLQAVQTHSQDGFVRLEQALACRDGSTITAEITIKAEAGENGISGDGLWLVRDISNEYAMRIELRELEKQNKVLGSYPWGLSCILNKNFYLTYVSPSVEAMLGFLPSEMLGEHLERYLHPEDLSALKKHFRNVLGGNVEAQAVITTARTLGQGGEYRKFNYRFLNYLDVARVRGVVANICEATEAGSTAHEIDGASPQDIQRDALTGLLTRTAAEQELEVLLESSRERRMRATVLWINLDQFYEINEAHGYELADSYLARVADLLIECVKSHADLTFSVPFEAKQLIARMGGDEFLIVLSHSNQSHAEGLAQSIIDRFQTGNIVAGIEQHVGVSIGIAIDSIEGEDQGLLLLNAESASIQAKKSGGNQHCLFHPRLAKRRRTLRELDSEVRGGVERREFSLFYQPQLSLRTGRVVGVEALLRWQHPERGLLLPNAFMEALHLNRLVDVMTRWALTRVCEQSAAWQKAGVNIMPISVNISEHQFQNPHLPAIIASVLMKTGMPARNLILEVTEASLIENNVSNERVTNELKQLGVRIGIGDFGVGYSSLNYLRRHVVSQIKLGKDFVQGLPGDTESSAIIAAIIAIGRTLKYQVIAECVETQAQVDHLRSLGCDLGQGFHLSAPLAADEFQAFALARQL